MLRYRDKKSVNIFRGNLILETALVLMEGNYVWETVQSRNKAKPESSQKTEPFCLGFKLLLREMFHLEANEK